MSSTETICDVLGRGHLARRLGVTKTAVSNAATSNQFPAKWFLVVSTMCAERGLDCPTTLFSFSSDQVSVDLPAEGEAA